MGLGAALLSRLTTAQTGDEAAQTAALATLTTLLADRIYPGVSTDNTYPLIVYEIHQENEDAITPMVAKEFTVTLTIAAQGVTAYGVAQQIKDATRALLDRKNSEGGPGAGAGGKWGGSDGCRCKCYLRDSDESNESDGGNSDALFYEVVEEYRVFTDA